MKFLEDDSFLGRWANNELTHEERNAFESSEEFVIYQKILDGAARLKTSAYDVEKSLSEVKKRTQKSSQSIVRTLVPYFSAAAAILIFILFYVSLTGEDKLQTGYGEIVEQVLPDGSQVQLNAMSMIKYNSSDWDDNRFVELEGEAFFNVEKGASFIVETTLGQVQVLGTSFNVYVRENMFEVRCFEGKVKVSGAGESYLTAGQSYREVNRTVESPEETTKNLPDWLQSQSVFKNRPVNHILIELTNQYGLTFQGNFPEDSLRMTVSFPNDNERLALDLVFKSLQKSYQRKSGGVIIID